MQHDASFVVGLVAEPASDPLGLLDDAVAALRAGVRDTEFEEAFDLGPPLLDRAREAGRLGHVRDHAGGEEPGPAVRGLVPAEAGRAVRRQQLTQEFLAGPGGADLVGRVVRGEDRRQSGEGLGAELVAASQ